MTAQRSGQPRRGGGRLRAPSVHLASVPRRAWADRWPLLVTAVVVALTAFLAVATPRLIGTTADASVQEAVRRAGPDAALTVVGPFEPVLDDGSGSQLDPTARIAATADQVRSNTARRVAGVFADPVAVVSTGAVKARLAQGDVGSTFLALVHVFRQDPPRVRWVEGGPGRVVGTAEDPGPVQVGLSEEVAAALGAGVGDRLPLTVPGTGYETPREVAVSGVFAAEDPTDPAWSSAPELLAPDTSGDGAAARTELAALLSAESLADAAQVLPTVEMTTTHTLAAVPEALDGRNAEDVAQRVTGLEASPTTLGGQRSVRSVTSPLDAVLLTAHGRVLATRAQASVLLTGVVVTGALALLVAARSLAGRRARVLGVHRARGASLAGTGAELALESTAVAAAGAGLGVLAAHAVVPGPVPWRWLVPVLAVAVLAGPVVGTWTAARSTGGRRSPANRSARRAAARDRRLGRVAVEAAAVLLAVAALAAARARGVVAPGRDGDVDLLVAAAPTLAALAAGLLLVRAAGPAQRWVLARTSRSPRVVPVLAAARGHAAAGHLLPSLPVVLAAATVALATVVGATVVAGQDSASWEAVGADVAARDAPDPALGAVAERLRGSDGVDLAVAARVAEGVQLGSDRDNRRVRVVAAEPAALAELLATTPLPDADGVERLGGAVDGAVPALVGGADGADGAGSRTGLVLRWEGRDVPLTAVGTAPALGGGGEQNVMVDAAALAAAVELPAAPDTVWVVGPGARDAVAGAPELADAEVTARTDWLAERREEPLTRALVGLAVVTAAVLLLLAGVVVVLDASSSAPGRGAALATLRTLGLTGRQATRIAAGELLPAPLLAAAVGTGLGLLLAAAAAGPLALRLVTGQATDPVLALPWWSSATVPVLLVVVLAVVAVESSVRRRERLGQVLRVGAR